MISLADLRGRKEAAAARLRDAGLYIVLWEGSNTRRPIALLRFFAHAVSIAMLKRKRREHGINHRWPDQKEIRDPIRDFFDGEIDWSTETDSIAEILETLTIVPMIDQSAMVSTICRNPNPLVSVQPQVLLTKMASENLGSSDDGKTSIALKAQQDTGFVLIKAIHGNTNLLFLFLVALGIMGLKEEVSKRLKSEVDSFDVKCKDHQGHLISIACDDDLMSYLNVFKPLGNQACRLFVISKIPN